MDDARIKHLEFIQAVITRMARNSFLLKGWSVTLATALLSLGKSDGSSQLAILAYVPLVFLWALDAYYLLLEQRFRQLYEDARKGQTPLFSMDITAHPGHPDGWLGLFVANTSVTGFHAPLIVAVCGVSLLVWA